MLRRGFNGFRGTFSSFRLHAYYSTPVASKEANSNPLLVEFPVKSVGMSEDKVTDPKVSHLSKSSNTPELVVNLFKESGFDEMHIKKLITANPRILRCDVEKTLRPKIRVLQELGLRGSDLGLVLSQQPQFMLRSLKSHIIPTLELLKSSIGCNEQLINLLLKTKCQILLSSNVLKNLPGNVELLKSYGIPSQKLKRFILQQPQFLLQRTWWLEQQLKRVEEKLGIPRTSPVFIYGISVMGRLTEERLESRFQVFYTYGWAETEILVLFRRQPLILGHSEKSLSAKLKCLMEDLGYGPDYLTARPCLLTYSLDKRIVPRNVVIQALKEKQLLHYALGFSGCMCTAESQFVNRYVLPFKDEYPELYENYTRMTGGTLSSIKP